MAPDARRGWRPHRYLWFGFLEDLDSTRRLPIGRIGRVRLAATPTAWLQPLLFFAVGVGLTFLPGRLPWDAPLGARLADALAFAVAGLVANVAHALGHVATGTLAGSPMDELLVTATRDANVYLGDQSAVPGRVHVARAVGGAVGNLAVAGLAYAVLAALPGAHPVLARVAGVNLFCGVGSFLPLPSVDGEVLWREARRALARPR